MTKGEKMELEEVKRGLENGLQLVNRLLENREGIEIKDIETRKIISDYILRLGIPINLRGYSYLVTAISMVIKDESLLKSITKRLYIDIAKVHKVTASGVERGIRTVIGKSINQSDVELYKGIFRCSPTERLSNGKYIAAFVNWFNLN